MGVRMKRGLITSYTLALLMVFVVVSAEVVQVHVLSRHCDRTPAKANTIPNNPVDWKKVVGVSFGQLTGLGEAQCYTVGQTLRDRYLLPNSPDYIQGIPDSYDADLFTFKSSIYERTLVSAMSITQGLFPNGTGLKNDLTGGFALPRGISAVPITSVPKEEDVLLKAIHTCPIVEKRTIELPKTARWQKLNSENQDFIKEIAEITGFNMTDIDGFHAAYDHLNCMKCHNLLKLQPVLDQWVKLETLAWDIQYLRHNREVQGNLAGGLLVDAIFNSMSAFIAGKQQPKYVHYSAHDTTILSLFAALDLADDFPQLQENINYGAQTIFELHKEGGQYFVIFIYRNGHDAAFVPFKFPQYCDSEKCKWNDFHKYLSKYSLIPTNQWCNQCGDTTTPTCAPLKMQRLQRENTGLLISVPIVATVTIVMFAVLLIIAVRLRNTKENKYLSL